jgi:hypothetical protein
MVIRIKKWQVLQFRMENEHDSERQGVIELLDGLTSFKVKGIYLGMTKQDLISALNPLVGADGITVQEAVVAAMTVPDAEEVTLTEIGLGRFILKFGRLHTYLIGGSVTDKFFNSGAMNVEQFVQSFVDAYKIPEMKKEYDPDSYASYYVYRDPLGYEVRILEDKGLMVRPLENAGKPQFD